MSNILFEVTSKLNKRIRTTKDYWSFIISLKHLEMEGKEEDEEGFLITTYITDKVKEGEEIWKR